MKKEEVTTINIKNFPMDLYVKVKEQAAKEHRTLKGLIIMALEGHLERHGGERNEKVNYKGRAGR